MDGIEMLLRARANPLWTTTGPMWGRAVAPLGYAGHQGHSEVIRELIEQFGIKGCGSASGGVQALILATATSIWKSWLC